jgi:hypothetical protein
LRTFSHVVHATLGLPPVVNTLLCHDVYEGWRSLPKDRKTSEARKRAHSPLLAAGLASESENEKLPYGEDSPWLAAGRLQSLLRLPNVHRTLGERGDTGVAGESNKLLHDEFH